MAHFAELDENNVVKRVVVVSNDITYDGNGIEREELGIQYLQNQFGGNWVQTSINNNFRKNFAGIGYLYDSVKNAFIPPKPFPSWSLDEVTSTWVPPLPKPEDPKHVRTWEWREEQQFWEETTPPPPIQFILIDRDDS